MEHPIKLCPQCMYELNEDDAQCPVCGCPVADPGPAPSWTLRPGTILASRYYVGNLQYEMGDGLVYLGYDLKLNCRVDITEFFPSAVCGRNERDSLVAPKSDMEDIFKDYLTDFLHLSRSLALYRDLPGIEVVYDIFEENATYYRVCEHAGAQPLEAWLEAKGGKLDWDRTRSLFMPMLSVLVRLHASRLYHGGISPQSLLVDEDGKLRISRFSILAARTKNTYLSPALYTGYTSPEQYDTSVALGPWTDIYAFAACMYRALTGVRPQDALLRRSTDRMLPASEIIKVLPVFVSDTLQKAMNLHIEERYHNAEELRRAISGVRLSEPTTKSTLIFDKKKGQSASPRHSKLYVPLVVVSAALFLLIIVAVVVVSYILSSGRSPAPLPPSSSVPSSQSASLSLSASSLYADSEESGDYSVPNLVGMEYSELLANTIINKYITIVHDGESYNDTVPFGVVYEQNVPVGTLVKAGSQVRVKVSKGPKNIPIPNLYNITQKDAETLLVKNNIKYTIVMQPDWQIAAGRVLSTDPAAVSGATIDAEATLKVIVSSGPVSGE